MNYTVAEYAADIVDAIQIKCRQAGHWDVLFCAVLAIARHVNRTQSAFTQNVLILSHSLCHILFPLCPFNAWPLLSHSFSSSESLPFRQPAHSLTGLLSVSCFAHPIRTTSRVQHWWPRQAGPWLRTNQVKTSDQCFFWPPSNGQPL